MKEPTEQEKYFKTKRLFIIGMAALFIIVFLLLVDRCNKGKEIGDAKTSYALIDSALKNVLSQDKHIRKYADSLEKRNSDLELGEAEARDNVEFYQKMLGLESYKAYRLSVELKKAKVDKDTARYIEKCDSLANANDSLWMLVRKGDTVELLLREREMLVKQNLLYQLSTWKAAYDSCFYSVKKADSLLPDLKPKSKLYIDGSVLLGAVTGVSGGGSLADTKGNKFSTKVSFTNFGNIYEVGYGRLLNFKKRK